MTTFKPSGAELDCLKEAAARLQAANASLGKAKKEADSAKATIQDWLTKERNVKLETLKIGDMISIEDVVLIVIGKNNRFDEKGFLASHPLLHAEFKKDFARLEFKPIGK